MKVAIISGSVYGSAEEVARHAAGILKVAGFDTWHNPRATLAEVLSFGPQAVLAVTSTTGMGELPDNLQPLYSTIRDQLPAAFHGLPGAVIGLGDASYGDTFCGGGELMRELFGELGIREVVPMLRLDASESVTPETDAEPWLAELISALQGLNGANPLQGESGFWRVTKTVPPHLADGDTLTLKSLLTAIDSPGHQAGCQCNYTNPAG